MKSKVVRHALRPLTRQYGGPVILRTRDDSYNLETGANTRSDTDVFVPRAIILPAKGGNTSQNLDNGLGRVIAKGMINVVIDLNVNKACQPDLSNQCVINSRVYEVASYDYLTDEFLVLHLAQKVGE